MRGNITISILMSAITFMTARNDCTTCSEEYTESYSNVTNSLSSDSIMFTEINEIGSNERSKIIRVNPMTILPLFMEIENICKNMYNLSLSLTNNLFPGISTPPRLIRSQGMNKNNIVEISSKISQLEQNKNEKVYNKLGPIDKNFKSLIKTNKYSVEDIVLNEIDNLIRNMNDWIDTIVDDGLTADSNGNYTQLDQFISSINKKFEEELNTIISNYEKDSIENNNTNVSIKEITEAIVNNVITVIEEEQAAYQQALPLIVGAESNKIFIILNKCYEILSGGSGSGITCDVNLIPINQFDIELLLSSLKDNNYAHTRK